MFTETIGGVEFSIDHVGRHHWLAHADGVGVISATSYDELRGEVLMMLEALAEARAALAKGTTTTGGEGNAA